MIVLVAGNLGESSSDPSRVTGGSKVLLRELGKSIGAGCQLHFYSGKEEGEDLLELVLEVLESQGVLQNGGVVRSVARHGSLVDGVGGGHGHGADGGGEGEKRCGQHYGNSLVIWCLSDVMK